VHTVDKYNTLHSAPRQLLVGFFRVLDFKIGSLLNLLSLFFCMRRGLRGGFGGLGPQYFCAFIVNVIAPRRPRTSPSRAESLGGYLDDGLATRTVVHRCL
jgi:hypothetical protein